MPRRVGQPRQPRQPRQQREEPNETLRQLAESVNRQSQNTSGDRFRRLQPPTFSGLISDPTAAERWIRKIEMMFKYAEVEERCKVMCAVFHLVEDAQSWWEATEVSIPARELNWERFKEVFYDKYFDKTTQAAKRMEFIQLKQTGSVADYVRKFDSLSRYAMNLISTNEEKVLQFVEGLRPEIYKGVKIAGTRGVPFSQVVAKALEVEEADARCVKMRQANRSFFNAISSQTSSELSYLETQGNKKLNESSSGQRRGKRARKTTAIPLCSKCNKTHFGVCRLYSGRCFRCGNRNHQVKDCLMSDERPRKTTSSTIAPHDHH